ncbi:MAG TPA: Gfo/Idh/MocA family oxidoreductase [Dehalococcoidia bacterium]|nr:Gfo/Idh/MocA family oxidoreductase [Dehalococcoidia bacterium]
MAPLRIGLIGCGFIGRFHARAFRGVIRRGLIDARYVAVCDRNEERARAFAEIADVPFVTTQATEVTDSPDVDVVYVCVPTAGHKELVLRAAGRGKHVFCEKPLATTLADVEEMVAAVAAAGVKAGVGLVLRHSPVYAVLKSLTEDSRLGRLMAVILRDDQFFPVAGHYGSEWRKDSRLVGSGTLLEHSIHDVDVLRWFGGEVRSVRGSVANFAGHPNVEDLATGHLEFAEGGTAELVSVWHNILSRPSTRRLELFFENGMFATDHDFFGPIQLQLGSDPARELSLEEVNRRYLELVGLRGEQYEQALARYSLEDYFFLKALAEDTEPFPDFPLALEAHRLVDAIYRSAEAGGEAVVLA